ncbi:fluoride efflux transporter FluC [Cellulomonas bogoriensis]|uniref:Fluoride-specific ion channel FluC n=1 Tax=Cellulomonas bogoriensis 69B4 = DSM 16987 TaxID=1386082 RepID=A0A0A0C0X7_9CELL|nr:CrcB family protein [Cellulomonas bogoriensis]KGM13069.1 chromosome condensation protein CrcB [Cellulomonas bogoriensis 69B4 = DSM 16987]
MPRRDTPPPSARIRPPHLDPRLVLVVAAGGAVGTAGRYSLTTTLGVETALPYATLAENVLGAFLLGLLLEGLVRRGPETPTHRTVRLAMGTGVLGGFTTYSALSIELERLLVGGDLGAAALYAVATVVLGLGACAAGVLLGTRRGR